MFKIVCVEAPTYTQGVLIKDKIYETTEDTDIFNWIVKIDNYYRRIPSVFFIQMDEHRDKIINSIIYRLYKGTSWYAKSDYHYI